MVKRGEIWWVDLGVPIGSAPGYERPCVIVSSDRFNSTKLNTIIVTSVFSNMQHARHAGNVILPAPITGLARDSVANVTQTGAIDRQLLIRQIGTVPLSLMRDIDAGLRLALQL